MICVIGSGLSGIAAATALVRRGFKPTILDAGVQASDDIASLKARLASVEPDHWATEDLRGLKQMGPATGSGIPRKLHFGSDFAYREADWETAARSDGAAILRSFARGGFSNVWGGVIPARAAIDCCDWPFDPQRLAPHYDATRRLLCPSNKGIEASTQATALYADLVQHQSALASEGIQFSPATLAVRSTDDSSGKGCRLCGLCLYGCPYDAIFSAASELTRMIQAGEVNYIPNVIVDRITPQGDGIQIDGRCPRTNAPRVFKAGTVFVAAGVLESARIVLNSTSGSAASLQVRQSDIFTIPMVRYRAAPGVSSERLHTLCQTILDVNDSRIEPYGVQLQLYGFNDQYREILKRRLGRMALPFQSALHHVTERLLVAFGYLHSDVSSTVKVTRLEGPFGKLRLDGALHEESRRIGRAVARKLFRNKRYLRAIPIPSQIRFDTPGAGHRSGGCFPMRRDPLALETDSAGSLPGLASVHLVDSSVLPSIVAGPLAFTVMANAHRIASECSIRHA